MRKFFYLLTLIAISLTLLQCEKKQDIVYEYVDLGLSVKWATCNIGATSPEEFGDYFAWGEIKPQKYYDWDTYKYGKRGDYPTCVEPVIILNKYTGKDEKFTLDPKDDAATANLGKAWRMPTKAELDELCNNCTWIWSTQNEVNGYKIIGPNGNSIFLPAAGHMDLNILQLPNINAWYWSSSLSHKASAAYNLIFGSSSINNDMYSSRCSGYSIRPVHP